MKIMVMEKMVSGVGAYGRMTRIPALRIVWRSSHQPVLDAKRDAIDGGGMFDREAAERRARTFARRWRKKK